MPEEILEEMQQIEEDYDLAGTDEVEVPSERLLELFGDIRRMLQVEMGVEL